jgi:cation transport regulator ChaB
VYAPYDEGDVCDDVSCEHDASVVAWDMVEKDSSQWIGSLALWVFVRE